MSDKMMQHARAIVAAQRAIRNRKSADIHPDERIARLEAKVEDHDKALSDDEETD